MYRILIAEDNKAISNLIKTHLSFAGYDTSQVYDGEFALEILEAEPFDSVSYTHLTLPTKA